MRIRNRLKLIAFVFVLIWEMSNVCCFFNKNTVYAAFDPTVDNPPIRLGDGHMLVLLNDGTVKACGENGGGQLGLGDYTGRDHLTTIPSQTGVKQVAAGSGISFLLMNDGTVKAFGNYSENTGYLGLGNNMSNVSNPTVIPGLTGVRQIRTIDESTLAVMNDGTVKGWGLNNCGQLGVGDCKDRNAPTTVSGLLGVKSVDVGAFHSVALLNDGSVKVWGESTEGQLGLGSTKSALKPTSISNLSGVKQLVAGHYHTVALMNDGTVKIWGGDNNKGELGTGKIGNITVPTAVQGLSGVVQVAAGDSFTLALMNDGTVKAWGYNTDGELGLGHTQLVTTPTTIPGLSGVKQIVCGIFSAAAVMNDNTVKVWGYNNNSFFGLGDEDNRLVPTTIPNFYLAGSPPQIKINQPAFESEAYGSSKSLSPQIEIMDADNGQLTCSLYVDSQWKETKGPYSNTTTWCKVDYSTLTLAEGPHTLKFQVSDGSGAPVEKSINIIVDKTLPVLGAVTFTPSDDGRGITVTGSASDTLSGLDPLPYRYTAGTSVIDWSANTSCTISPLSPNTKYTAKFEARDKAGNLQATTKELYTKALVPTVIVDSVTETSVNIKLSGGNPLGTKYQVYTNDSVVADGVAPSDNKVNIANLVPGRTYNIKVRAINGDNVATNFSTEVQATTYMGPPANLNFSATKNTVTVSWNAMNGAVKYDLEADGAIIYSGTATGCSHNGLEPGTTHKYRVRSVYASSNGNWSGYYTCKTLPNPPATTPNLRISKEDITNTSIKLVWDPVIFAGKYQLRVNGTQLIDISSDTEYTHTGLTPNTEYTYEMRAVNDGGESPWSSAVTECTFPDPPGVPANVTAQATKSTVTVTWSPSANAESYEIKVDGEIKSNGANTSYFQDGLAPLSGHKYQVRAVNRGYKSLWSSEIEISTYPEGPGVPTNVLATAEKDSVTLTWYKVPFAESYDIEVDGKIAASTTKEIFIHSGLAPNTQHTYRVKAHNISDDSDWSKEVSIYTLPQSEGTNLALSNVVAVVTNNSIMLSWDAAAYEGEYEIEVDGALQDNGNKTVYNHTRLQPETYHTYKVRVKDKQGLREWCAVLSLCTLSNLPDAPLNLKGFATTDTIELRWDRAEGAEGYDLEIDGGAVESVTDSVYKHENLMPGTAHTYRVRAKNTTGITAWSPSITVSTTNPTYVADCIEGKEFDLSLIASNVQDFTGIKFVVTYNPDEIEVTDLYKATPFKDVAGEGSIPGTKISAKYTSGRIEFTVNDSIAPGTSWSGELTAIIFRAKITGRSNLDITVE